jgi:hypothetical protein
MAANGTGDVDRAFNALYKLVLYTHLEERYRGRVAVILDGDASGLDTVTKLQAKFSQWPSEAFTTFAKEAFELYYPDQFQARAIAALAETDEQLRRNKKRQLLLDVVK